MSRKTAIITGGAQGIGKDIVLALAKEGYNTVVADINYEQSKETVLEAKKFDIEAIAIDVDISKEAQVAHMVKKTIDKFGSIDILVNNAAYVKKIKFLDYETKDWNDIINVCINGYFYCSQFVAREMVKNGGGKIINISSMVGMIAHGGLTAYAAAKSGVISMTKLAAMELKKHNITVNAIAPGPVDTPLMKNVMGKMSIGTSGAMLPPSAIGKSEDIAKSVIWLINSEGTLITGNIVDLGAALIG